MRRRPGLRLAHAPRRQQAQCGNPAANETRAAQESAAIERGGSLRMHGAAESAAAALTFRSPDQHGRLLSSGID
jgi:hypothetical protein